MSFVKNCFSQNGNIKVAKEPKNGWKKQCKQGENQWKKFCIENDFFAVLFSWQYSEWLDVVSGITFNVQNVISLKNLKIKIKI